MYIQVVTLTSSKKFEKWAQDIDKNLQNEIYFPLMSNSYFKWR